MRGLVLNFDNDRLPEDHPLRTREEERSQLPAFHLEDGYPIFEVWFWHDDLERWFVMSREVNARLASTGVIYFFGVPQLKAWIAHLYAERKRASG